MNKKVLASLSKQVGLNPAWVELRIHWDAQTKKYDRVEQSADGKNWQAHAPGQANVSSITYVGGPRNGEVEV